MLKRFINYCKLSYNELVHKTTWPTSKQLTSQAVLVFVSSLLLAVVVFGMDRFFEAVTRIVYP
ncbi:MAG: preprotein translocase subunit SecE [Bacteroidales bacterium]|nr:preprotein translocase subunit SecE [Bacteroidales bacterium]